MANTEILEKILGNDLCAKWINLRDYAFDKLSANPDIKAIMDTSDKKIVAGVPVMTSNTTPEGEVFANRFLSGYEPWKAFNGQRNTSDAGWYPAASGTAIAKDDYCGYHFSNPTKIKGVYVGMHTSGAIPNLKFKIQGSNNKTSWVDLTDEITFILGSGNTWFSCYENIDNNDTFTSYRLIFTENAASSSGYGLKIQFYIEQTDSKYGYGEWVCEGQVPVMTSNTAPYGEAGASSYYSTYYPWQAFNINNTSTSYGWWQNRWGDYVYYKFLNPVIIKKVAARFHEDAGRDIKDIIQVIASNDGVNWVNIGDEYTMSGVNVTDRFDIDNDTSYLYYGVKVVGSSNGYGPSNGYGWTFQFYAYQPKGNVPIMTSNTAPYGEAISSSEYSTNYPTWNAFNGDTTHPWAPNYNQYPCYIGYHFVNPICVKKVWMHCVQTNRYPTEFKIQGSNDNSTWDDVSDVMTYNASSPIFEAVFDNDNYYLYYRMYITKSNNMSYNPFVYGLQFYGREMKVSVPAMTSNTAPWGEVISDKPYQGSFAKEWKVFDKDVSTGGATSASGPSESSYIGYKFLSKKVIKKVLINPMYSESLRIKDFKIQGSDDGTTWTDLYSGTFSSNSNVGETYFDIDNENEYLYFNVLGLTSYIDSAGTSLWLREIQFFGFDYSERDWDTEHPMRYLYDHGVELEEVEELIYNYGGTVEKTTDSIIIHDTTSSGAPFIVVAVDTTDYDLDLVCIGDQYSGLSDFSHRISRAKNVSAGDLLAYRTLLASDLPYNAYISITNITGLNYVMLGTYGVNTSGNVEITEWWLK